MAYANGKAEFPHTVEDFEGIWQQVNGASVITIKDNEFEIVNMELGWAGYGLISFESRGSEIYLRFDCNNQYEGRNTRGYLLNLNMDQKEFDRAIQIARRQRLITRDFMIEAWEDFSVPIDEREIGDEYSFRTGGINLKYALNGNNLKVYSWDNVSSEQYEMFKYWFDLFTGEFVRTN